MRDAAVSLNIRQRRIACQEIAAKLLVESIEVIVVAVDDHHYHVIAKFPDHQTRHWIGRAKFHSSMVLRGDKPHARVWASGCRAWPIRDRGHQINAYNYIVEHGKRGAAVWTFRDPVPICTQTPSSSRRQK